MALSPAVAFAFPMMTSLAIVFSVVAVVAVVVLFSHMPHAPPFLWHPIVN